MIGTRGSLGGPSLGDFVEGELKWLTMPRKNSSKKSVNKDLRDERRARLGYETLARQLRSVGRRREARTILSIAKDEGEHFRRLTKIKRGF